MTTEAADVATTSADLPFEFPDVGLARQLAGEQDQSD